MIQRVSGENKEKLRKESHKICAILNKNNHNVSCTMLEEESFEEKPKKEIFTHAFNEINKADTLLAIVRSEKRSEGFLIEVGYAIAKNKRIILAIKKKVINTYLREMVSEFIEFENNRELYIKLKNLS